MSNILSSIREVMGLADEDAFDADLVMFINSALAIVNQNGVGTPITVTKEDTATWSDFMGEQNNEALLGIVQQYVYLKTKILFDPPPPSVMLYIDKTVDELLWRIRDGIGDPNF